MKVPMSIAISLELLQKIDKKRGKQSRSSFVEEILEKAKEVKK